jgi:recombination protein RecA
MFGSPETTPGGRALKFYSSVRLDIRRVETIKDGAEMIGNRTRVKVVKNKVSPPFKQAEFDIMYGQGISREGSLLDVGVELGIINKAGAWFTYEGEQLGQGRENVKQFFKDNVDMMVEIMEKIRVQAGLGEGDEAELDVTADAVGGPNDGADGFGPDADLPIDLEATVPAAKPTAKSKANGKDAKADAKA